MGRSLIICAALAAAIGGCASTGQVRRLQARVAELEAAQRQRANDEATTQLELEGRLIALRLEVQRLTAAATDDELAARVERLERQGPPAPMLRPSRPAPDPAVVYAVPIAGAPALGGDDALVTIVRAGEYACPYCEKTRPTLDELRRIYGRKLRIVYRTYVVHPQLATIPARAACAAHLQQRFWDMDDLLWEKAFKARTFDRATIDRLAAELGLDLGRFAADLDGPCVAEVQDEMAVLERFGVRATPVFFINGRFLTGAQPTANFQVLIDEELAKAELRLKKSRKRSGYYEQYVLGQGLPGLAPAPAIAAPPSP